MVTTPRIATEQCSAGNIKQSIVASFSELFYFQLFQRYRHLAAVASGSAFDPTRASDLNAAPQLSHFKVRGISWRNELNPDRNARILASTTKRFRRGSACSIFAGATSFSAVQRFLRSAPATRP